jgi:hypothetical protein
LSLFQEGSPGALYEENLFFPDPRFLKWRQFDNGFDAAALSHGTGEVGVDVVALDVVALDVIFVTRCDG